MAIQNKEHPQIQIINRVVNLPIVHSALEVAKGGYDQLKGYNGLVKATLSKAEDTIWFVAETSKPVINKFEKPINFADNLACKGLDKLEEKAPVIKKSTEELKGETQKLYGNGIHQIEDKVKSIKEYGAGILSGVLSAPYLQALIKSVETAIVLTENAVDHYLPPVQDEKPLDRELVNQQNVIVRMGHLSEKMRKRVYAHVVQKYVPIVIVAVNNFKATVLVWLMPKENQQTKKD